MMNKIDEIALRVAKAYEALSEIDDCARMDIGVDAIGPRKVLEQFIADVEELAELSKDAEPVAWINACGDYVELSTKSTVYGSHTIPLFTHPATDNTAEIEHA